MMLFPAFRDMRKAPFGAFQCTLCFENIPVYALYVQVPADGDEAGDDAECHARAEHDEGKLHEVGQEIGEEIKFGHQKRELGGREPRDWEKHEQHYGCCGYAVQNAADEKGSADKPGGCADETHDADFLAHGVDRQTNCIERDEYGDEGKDDGEDGPAPPHRTHDGRKTFNHRL